MIKLDKNFTNKCLTVTLVKPIFQKFVPFLDLRTHGEPQKNHTVSSCNL
jgi:hypothetical protein